MTECEKCWLYSLSVVNLHYTLRKTDKRTVEHVELVEKSGAEQSVPSVQLSATILKKDDWLFDADPGRVYIFVPIHNAFKMKPAIIYGWNLEAFCLLI